MTARWIAVMMSFSTLVVFADSPLGSADVDGISEYYRTIVEKIAPREVPFTNDYGSVFLMRGKARHHQRDYDSSCLNVYGQFHFIVNTKNRDILQIWNHDLNKYIETNGVQRIPCWTIERAYKQACQYLIDLRMPLPSNMIIKAIRFSQSRWCVHWQPSWKQYKCDSFDTCYVQEIAIEFHEKLGFIGYTQKNDYPMPKREDVVVTQDAAITKASIVVPLIQRSPYYLQCRLPGFVVSGVLTAELLVAAPNWLLDPKRAVWLRDRPPEETRLCWVVTFTSVYTGKAEPGELLVPPLFLVYIDAATGEIVGANFT